MIKNKSGFILINKPAGPTSHDIVNKMRRITGIKKIGHAGTLDPFASGVLLLAIGREATREISRFVKLDKEYEALLRLGAVTDTFDRTGKRLEVGEKLEVRSEKLELFRIKKILEGFVGVQKQVPPMYSAKKIKGRKLYELARRGIEIERVPVEINIYELDLLAYEWPNLRIRARCSSGTYIRTLGHDIGQALGCGAYLEELKRTAVGDFRIEDCVEMENLDGVGDEVSLVGKEEMLKKIQDYK